MNFIRTFRYPALQSESVTDTRATNSQPAVNDNQDVFPNRKTGAKPWWATRTRQDSPSTRDNWWLGREVFLAEDRRRPPSLQSVVVI